VQPDWISNASHFAGCKRVACTVIDVVTRYWIGYSARTAASSAPDGGRASDRRERRGGRESGEMIVHRLPGETAAVVAFRAGRPASARAAFEAAPTGFGLLGRMLAAWISCVVDAPGKIESPDAGPGQDRPPRC
jgi:hypothetical protein